MRVAIDLLIAEKEPGGMLFSTRALIEGLARVDQINEYIIITGRPQEYQMLATTPNMRIHPVKLHSWRGMMIKHQLLLPDVLRRLRPDVLHVPAFAAPIGWHGPLVLTVHDLAFLKVPDQSSLYARLYWQYLLRESSRRAQRIIAISEKTRDELVSYWAVETERIRLIHNALRPSLHFANIPDQEIQVVRQRYGERYLLHTGRIMPRKNVERLVQAFELLAPRFGDLHLVLTGGAGYGSKEVLQQIEASPYRERIHLVGWVSDRELGVLYAGASALVFPSKHEGFGLPIVEAMACGTPVVASAEAASMEIAGEAVIRADCSSAPPLAEAIAQVLSDEALRERLIRLGRTQILPFTIEACAEATIRVYQEALGINEPPIPSTASDSTPIEAYPDVSVIVPVSRLELASRTLASLSHQRYAGKIEITVVGAIANELAQHWSVIPVNPGPIHEPGKARNLGTTRATADVLLFLDDDCVVAEDWVERNVRALQQPNVGVVGARICGKSRSFFARCTDFTNFGYYQHGHPIDGPVASASMGIWRAAFYAAGGFDETQRSGEDMDLCYRIQKQGYRTVYQPDIVVSHDHQRDTLGKLLRYNYSHGLAGGLKTKIQHRDIGLKNRLLYGVRLPPIFLLLLPLIALTATVRIVVVNIGENLGVLLYSPFILSGKLAYEFGIFQNMIARKQPRTGVEGVKPALVMKTTLPPVHAPRQQLPGSRRSRRLAMLCGCIALFVLVSTLALYQKYNPQYHRDMALARAGVQHLQNAEKLLKNLTQGSLDAHSITQARQEFVAAYGAFSQVRSDLAQVPIAATYVPKYGSWLSAALYLVPLAIELSQAGMVGCDALNIVISHLREPLDNKAQGITMEDLTIIKRDVTQIQGLLNTSTEQVNQLQPSDLYIDSRVGPAIATFRTALPKLQRGLQDMQTMLNVAPVLLGIGQPTSYLVEQLDSTELRPGGGFIGSYGIATFSDGHITSIHMMDAYLLDKPFEYSGHKIAFPPTYNWFQLAPSWSLRDSNLDADFPTAARYAEQIYHTEGGTNPVQGVIAITPWFIENALKITGPIYVDEYNETITAQNLINRIHYHQLNEELRAGDIPSPDGHSSLRKRFTELLFEHFFVRVRQIAPTAMPQFVSLLRDSLHTKDIQIYLNSGTAEDLLQRYQLASTIQAPVGDSLFVVDANIQANKANYFMTYTLHDQVTIDSLGNALHRTTLTYNWPYSEESLRNDYGGTTEVYTDYVRIYIPPGSILQAQDGWVLRSTSQAFGREVLAGIFHLQYGRSGTITLTWMVHGAAVQDAHGWHYRYLIQRQAGITWHLNLQVTLPTCAHITNKLGNLTLSGSGMLDRYLTTDSDIRVDYICS